MLILVLGLPLGLLRAPGVAPRYSSRTSLSWGKSTKLVSCVLLVVVVLGACSWEGPYRSGFCTWFTSWTGVVWLVVAAWDPGSTGWCSSFVVSFRLYLGDGLRASCSLLSNNCPSENPAYVGR